MESLNISENSDVLISDSENFRALLKDITEGKTSLVCDQTYSVLKQKCSFKTIEILPNTSCFTTTIPVICCIMRVHIFL